MFHVKLFRGFFPHLFVDIDEEKAVFTVRAGQARPGAGGKGGHGRPKDAATRKHRSLP